MIGADSKGQNLDIADICSFKIEIEGEAKELEGMVVYDEESFAYAFEMQDDNFPIVLMNKTTNIKRIINVWSTKKDDRFEFYRDIYRGKRCK